MSDIPRRAVTRTARLAGLPIGFAGRTVLGLGRRVTGLASEVISADVQQRTAEHLFRVLGGLKGGAMKLGQALSIFEAALPEELAGPYRQALTRLQEAAPPMPAATVPSNENSGTDDLMRFQVPGVASVSAFRARRSMAWYASLQRSAAAYAVSS